MYNHFKILEPFHYRPRSKLFPLSVSSHSPVPLPTMSLFSVVINLSVLDIWQAWNHIIVFCDSLLPLSGCFQGSSLWQYVSVPHPSIWLNNIPPRGTFCSFIHQWVDIYIASTLRKIKNTAINISCISFWVNMLSVFLGIYRTPGSFGNSSTFWGASKLFPKDAAPFYVPTSNKWRPQFHQLLSNTFQFFKSYPSDCIVSLWVWLVFP